MGMMAILHVVPTHDNDTTYPNRLASRVPTDTNDMDPYGHHRITCLPLRDLCIPIESYGDPMETCGSRWKLIETCGPQWETSGSPM